MADNFYSQYLEDPTIFSCGNQLTNYKLNQNLTSNIDLTQIDELTTLRAASSTSSLRYFGTQSYNMNIKNSSGNLSIGKYSGHNSYVGINGEIASNHINSNTSNIMNQYGQQQHQVMNHYIGTSFNRNRYTPYQNRPSYALPLGLNNNNNNSAIQNYQQQSQSQQSQQQQFSTIYENQSLINYTADGYGRNELPTNFNLTNTIDSNSTINNNNSSSSINNSLNSSLNNNGPSPPQSSSSRSSSSSFCGSAGSTATGSNSSYTEFGNLLDTKHQPVTLQINNLDYSLDEASLRSFLLNQLKPITPVLSLIFEGSSYAKVSVPDLYFAKQVVANLHRKKIGHKRMVVSYTRDSSLTEINTLRCQVAGLLKDVPYCTLPMYKFRELFQSRFKTSISVLDLYKMQDLCNITPDKSEEKFISLNAEFINSIENNPECLQDSVPYCTIHFKREQHKGWAEQDIEPLPNVFMTIAEIKQITYPLLKTHSGDIPVNSLAHCIAGELGIQILANDNGVNLEHLICCVNGIQITTNNYGIKILSWLEPEMVVIGKENCGSDSGGSGGNRFYSKCGTNADPLYQISREVIELIKISPKSTMKFNRFIPAYHNHFGKQCRVADYGYTKLIELFEALSSVVQIMGDGENRQITLTHRTQIRRFTTDLLRVLRTQGNKSVLLSQLSEIFVQTQNRCFDITDYGVCSIIDILDGLANSNIVVTTTIQNGKDILISIPKRKQTSIEVEKTCVFACEAVELFRNAPNYSILFQKFVRSYHYHFGYQCRLSDYGFLKLADLMESIQGIVEIEFTTDEDKKIFLTPKIAKRVFAEQLEELIGNFTGSSETCMKLEEVLKMHKKKFGYQIQSQTLGYSNILDAIKDLPYIELIETDDMIWIICHNKDTVFRTCSYQSCGIVLENGQDWLPMNEFMLSFLNNYNETITENTIAAMKHAIEVKMDGEKKFVGLTRLMKFIISIIKLLEQKIMTISEIKSILHIGLGDCFEFGYPNLYTLIRAHSDIFVCELGQTQGRSEVGLVAQGELIAHINSNNQSSQFKQNIIINNKQSQFQHLPQQTEKKVSKGQNSSRQPLTSYNGRSMSSYNTKNVSNIQLQQVQQHQQQILQQQNNLLLNTSGDFQLKQNIVAPPPGLPPKKLPISLNAVHHINGQIPISNKENSFNNYSFNTSSTSSIDLNTSSGNLSNNLSGSTSFNGSIVGINGNIGIGNAVVNNGVIGSGGINGFVQNTGIGNTNIDVPKLWDRRNVDYFTENIKYNENDDIFDLFKTAPICPVYNTPKPTSHSDVIPFWIDPVWTNNNNDDNSSGNKSLSMEMPELKTFNILPMLMSPHQLLKSDNMKRNLFSFDSPDKKIS